MFSIRSISRPSPSTRRPFARGRQGRRGSGPGRPDLKSRARIANVARRRRGKPSARPRFPAQAGERETASAASHPSVGHYDPSASMTHKRGRSRQGSRAAPGKAPPSLGRDLLNNAARGAPERHPRTTQRAGPALPASSSFGRRRLKLNSGRDGAAGILAFARLIQRGPSPATREQGKLPAPVARLVRAAPTGQHRPVSVNQTPRASPARAPPHRRWSSSMA